MTVYGKVTFVYAGETMTAALTNEGWQLEPHNDFSDRLRDCIQLLYDPADYGAAYGNPMGTAVKDMAARFHGIYELATLPKSPPGTLY